MRILLAFNGSELSRAALRAVIAEHRPDDTVVRVLHLVPVDEWEGRHGNSQAVIQQAGAELRNAGFRVETEVLKGTSSYAIIEAAEQWKADLIVLGWHARTALKRLLFGSIPYAVVHHAPCSVELVRMPAHNDAYVPKEESSARSSVARR